MTMKKIELENRRLQKDLESELFSQFGPLLTGDALRKVLGFPSMNSLRKASSRGTLPVPIFPLAHRRGKFALVKDVARWLAEQRNKHCNK